MSFGLSSSGSAVIDKHPVRPLDVAPIEICSLNETKHIAKGHAPKVMSRDWPGQISLISDEVNGYTDIDAERCVI